MQRSQTKILTVRALEFHFAPRSPQVAIVIPVFNEEDVVTAFHQRLRKVIDALPYTFSIIYINDGSTDGTQAALEAVAQTDLRVTVLELSRNFGHQAALTAGLDRAEAEWVISMDGDGEHPPELIPEMLALAAQGYEVVLAQRQEPQRAGWFKRWTSAAFYYLLNRIASTPIPPGVADFRLLHCRALEALRQMREYHRFLRGMVGWMGFRTVILPYAPAPRLGGHSHYSLQKMLRLAFNAIFSFSLVPLYLGISLGGVFLLLALLEALYVLSFWLTGRQASLAPGWSSLMFVLLFVGGSLMIMLGIIGLYVGYIFQEVKQRPIYFVRRVITFSPDAESEHTPDAPPTPH
ncbi:glycosyltransferase family 2 protein [uncultured Thermanaerothrix sp.]|uniref:glycosyltransferase family 2 protein n=1 Tax=uncultured Thermanaerothrix sp. TaxID=1195149 RepID=UPI0026145167|nr:glycosyltransferase family 2 protein [uncultured Thermanaerothrix sp.]